MPYTPITYTVTSGQVSTPEFSYAAITLSASSTINHLDQLVISLNGAVLTPTTDYTVNENDEILTVSATIAEDDLILIERDTDIDTARVNFQNNALIDKDNLNTSYEQVLFKQQELETEIGNSITLDLTFDCWDAQNKRICNVATATASTDATNLAQVQNLIAGSETATVDSIERWVFTGDAVETDFVLNSAPSGLLLGSQLMVYVGGILQRPTNHYDLDVTGTVKTLQFTSAPDALPIQVLTVQGVVSAVLAADTIDGSAIVADSIGTTQLNIGAGDALRFLVFDAAGNPTGRTLLHTDVSDFDTGVRQNRLDQMAAPTASVSANSQKVTSLLSGTASSDAVNKGQMDTAISTAVAAAGSSLDLSATTLIGLTSLASPYERTNATAKAKFVVGSCDCKTSMTITASVKTSGGAYVQVGHVSGNIDPSISFFVPAGGTYKFVQSGATGGSVTITEQSF